MAEPPDFSAVLEAYIAAGLAEVNKTTPARVSAYDADTQTCSVTPMVQVPDSLGGYHQLPDLDGVKVAHIRGGGFMVAVPLTVGDFVLLIFQDQSTAEFHQTGAVSKPKDVRRHGLYAYALPCVFPDSKALASASGTKLVIGKDGSDARIEFDGTTVAVGPGATDAAALASKVDAALADLKTMHNTHTHPVAGATAGVTGMQVTAGTATASDLLKVKS